MAAASGWREDTHWIQDAGIKTAFLVFEEGQCSSNPTDVYIGSMIFPITKANILQRLIATLPHLLLVRTRCGEDPLFLTTALAFPLPNAWREQAHETTTSRDESALTNIGDICRRCSSILEVGAVLQPSCSGKLAASAEPMSTQKTSVGTH